MALPLETITVRALAEAMAHGRLTSRELTEHHLARVAAVDPYFGAVRALAPDAAEQAAASDEHRRRHGARSPLEGIPVLVKDNVDVAGMPTTAGALALEHSTPGVDAPVIARLRAAGAVVLGKTNLSELANFLTEDMPSGYSSLGGQVLNPYDTTVTPSGSSSGSAAAVALGLAPLAVGTETDGSIIAPAEHQSLVGVKPTLGLVSRTGILPIAPSQDTAGPMARTVADAAALLAVLAGRDPDDAATAAIPAELLADGPATAPGAPDGLLAALGWAALAGAGLGGVRLGVVAPEADPEPGRGSAGRRSCHDDALAALRRAGAVLRTVTLPASDHADEAVVLHHEFAPAVDRYLAALGPDAPIRSMEDLHAWNREHPDDALKFGQSHVDRALAVDHDVAHEAYLRARARDVEATAGAMLAALGSDLEALVFPGLDGCTWAARAGWPSVVLPAGYEPANRRPVGVMLVGRPWSDGRLLALAHAAEAVLPVRRPPSAINPAAFRRL